MKQERNKTLQQQMTDKYIISSCYIGAQSDLTQVMTLNKKLRAQLLRLIGHKGKSEL